MTTLQNNIYPPFYRKQVLTIKNMKIMKKILFFAAVMGVAFTSCMNEEFIGDNSPTTSQGVDGAINFVSNAGKITRATSNTGTVVQMLDGQFKVYGVKSGETAGSDLQKVFVNYSVWDVSSPYTTSNSSGWEYVGANGATGLGTGNISLSSDQTIKYWDHSAADYRFVAGSPISAFTFGVNSTTNAIETATVTGLSGHIDPNTSGSAITTYPVYIADPLIITEPSYSIAYGKAPVQFTFRRQQSRVRVGIYETIPGYKITAIHFYTNGASTAETGTNIILTSGTSDYFVGGSSAQVKGTLTYAWTGEGAPKYTFAYSNVDDSDNDKKLKRAQNWYGGALTGVKAVTSNHATVSEFYGTDDDMDATGYFTVLPTQVSTAAPLLIKCDYTLTSLTVAEGGDGSGETINVTGATAAIPAAFSKWEPNTTYTYLFKISDNTNGKTNKDKDAVGLYPITFDAVATADANGIAQGYITTVSIPSITTYQAESVTDEGIQYAKEKEIYFTVQNNTDGGLYTLNTTAGSVGCVKVFYLGNFTTYPSTKPATEADLQVTAPTTEVSSSTPSGSTALSLPAAAWTNNGQSVATTKYGKFTPGADGYYAIQYLTTAATAGPPAVPAAYTYKVIKVGVEP